LSIKSYVFYATLSEIENIIVGIATGKRLSLSINKCWAFSMRSFSVLMKKLIPEKLKK